MWLHDYTKVWLHTRRKYGFIGPRPTRQRTESLIQIILMDLCIQPTANPFQLGKVLGRGCVERQCSHRFAVSSLSLARSIFPSISSSREGMKGTTRASVRSRGAKSPI